MPKFKGGRSYRLQVRMTNAVKERLQIIADIRGETMADSIEYLVLSEHHMIVSGNYDPLPTPKPAPLKDER